MSGQYPGGYGSPMGGHRGHMSPQPQNTQQQQQQQQMGNPNTNNVGMPGISGGFQAGGLISQHPHSPMQGGMRGVMNSPSHIQQQQQQQQAIQQTHNMQPMQQQHRQQQQMNIMPGTNVVRHMLAQQHHSQTPPDMQSANLQQQQHHQQHQHQFPQPQQNASAHQHQNVPPTQTSSVLAISQQNPNKEINIVALSRLGQETVQDITSRFQEIFGALKIIQPSANRDNSTEKKVQEYFRTIRLLFKRLRIIYEKCNDGYPQGMEYTQVESLISFKDEPERRTDLPQCEEYRKAVQENQELIETVKLKNRQLREIIDRTRIIIWEINTMLSMRRS